MSDREWQPIETAPKDGRLVLIRTAAGDEWAGTFTAHWSRHSNGWFYSDHRTHPRPTHWMPLPPAPSRQKEDAHV